MYDYTTTYKEWNLEVCCSVKIFFQLIGFSPQIELSDMLKVNFIHQIEPFHFILFFQDRYGVLCTCPEVGESPRLHRYQVLFCSMIIFYLSFSFFLYKEFAQSNGTAKAIAENALTIVVYIVF